MPYPYPERYNTSPEGLLQLIRAGESSSVEFKRRLPPENILARLLTAFANSEGGIILIGVDENNEVGSLPHTEVPDTLARLTSVSESVLFLPAYVNAAKIGVHWVAYAVVEPHPRHVKPVRTAEGAAFRRVGSREEPIEEMPPPSEPQATSGSLNIFVAMSFREEEEPALVDYFQAMQRAAQRTGLPLNLWRVDQVEGDYEISQKIMDEIKRAEVVISDFTLSSHNVYFELGYARGLGKQIVQTARKKTHLEFDVRNWRTLFYKNATELEALLVNELTNLYARLRSGGS